MQIQEVRHRRFLHMFGSAVVVQALLSATNFIAGLVLIRRASESDYGYFVLVSTSTLFLTGLQNAFLQPPMAMRMAKSTPLERADLVGGVYRGQRRIVAGLGAAALLLIAAGAVFGVVTTRTALIAVAGSAAMAAGLYREYFRSVLLSFRRSQDVLRADAFYGAIVLLGVPLATFSPAPAVCAVLAVAAAAVVGGQLLSRLLWRYEPWNSGASAAVLHDMVPLGGWSALGSATHWAFSQGYNYLVAGILDVTAVAALAATRLLMMPVNLLSSGVGSLMMPTSLAWLQDHGPARLFRRLLLIASGLAAGASCYFVAVWLMRDLIFEQVMHKQFAQSGFLVLSWSAVFFVMIFRDQLNFFPGASGLYRRLTILTGASAVVALCVGYACIRRFGTIGAPLAVLLGELCNLVGIVYLSLRQIGRRRD
jgi:O-antigen/teichoic acid export membrane protein